MAQFTNQASLSYNGITVNSNIVTGELTAPLTVEKTATRTSYQTGDVVTYVISLRNTGVLPLNALTISDNLGAYEANGTSYVPLTYTGDPVLYYLDGVLQTAPAVTAGPPLSITGINVPAGSNVVLVYRTTANNFAPLGADGDILNTATITGAGLNEALTAAETVTADTDTRITVLKSLDPLTVSDNGTITYTFTLQNYGAEADAAAAITLTDTFNPRLNEPLTVTLNGATLTQAGNYTYDATTGVFSTTPGIITVPGATATQDPTTGIWTITPGVAVVTVSGTV